MFTFALTSFASSSKESLGPFDDSKTSSHVTLHRLWSCLSKCTFSSRREGESVDDTVFWVITHAASDQRGSNVQQCPCQVIHSSVYHPHPHQLISSLINFHQLESGELSNHLSVETLIRISVRLQHL